jgi:hypothetical protein
MNDYQEVAFPSVPKIAGYTSQSERTVQKHLGIMCEFGYLQNMGIHPKYGTTIYNICTPAGDAPPQLSPIPPAGAAPKLTNITNQVSLSKEKRFSPPSIEQLTEYQNEATLTFEPEGFIDYWSSVGWKRGRTPMKCWKATARNWARNEKNGSIGKDTGNNIRKPKQTVADRLRADLASIEGR